MYKYTTESDIKGLKYKGGEAVGKSVVVFFRLDSADSSNLNGWEPVHLNSEYL